MKLIAVVEGHGEVEAVPVLLRRFADQSSVPVDIGRPIRVPRGRLVKEHELRRAIALAALQAGANGAILVLLDADQDCPARLGPELLAWARAERADRRIAVVVARQEFEAWFVAAAASLVRAGRLQSADAVPMDPESLRDPKGWLSERLGRRYSETTDQPRFAALFDLAAARQCASFDKFERDVALLLVDQAR